MTIKSICHFRLSLEFILSIFGKPYDASATFDVNRFGTFTANFKAVPPPVPPEYWIPLYGIIVSTIVGWSIPSIIGWIKSKKQGSKLDHYHNEIKKVYDDAKIDRSDIQELDSLRDNITDEYTRGKINKESYNKLVDEISVSYGEIITKEIDCLNNLSENDKVKRLSTIIDDIEAMHTKGKINNDYYTDLKKQTSILYQEIFRRRIDSLNSLAENNEKLLDEIKEDISDAYSKEKISELHYTLLEKKLSNYENPKT